MSVWIPNESPVRCFTKVWRFCSRRFWSSSSDSFREISVVFLPNDRIDTTKSLWLMLGRQSRLLRCYYACSTLPWISVNEEYFDKNECFSRSSQQSINKYFTRRCLFILFDDEQTTNLNIQSFHITQD